MGSTTFDYTGGRQSYTVPDGISQLQVTLFGAGGGNSSGGYVEGTLDVTPGETLYIYVGGSNSGTSGGWPDGGDGKAASGNSNGASSGGGAGSVQIRRSGDTLSDRVAVAGGGGGTQGIYIDASSNDLGVSGPGDGGADTGGSSSSASTSNTSVSGNGGGSQSGGGGGASPNGTDGSGPSGGTGGVASASDVAYASGAGGGGGGGYYGGGAGAADAWVSGSDTGEASANGGAGGSNYTGGLASVASNTQGGGNSGDGQVVLFAETPPQNVDATYVADDRVDLSFDDVDADSYEVQIQRDGGTWEDPAGGPSSFPGGSASYSGSYGPNSDTAYGRQVGIDSSFRFRARAIYGGSPSAWAYSDTVYTTPVPPHNPSVSRPDSNTIEISWEITTEHLDYYRIQFREDSGGGYSNWWNLTNGNTGGIFGSPPADSGVTMDGDTITVTLVTGDAEYQYNRTLDEDRRYQFRVLYFRRGNDSGILSSEVSYTDYGNNGNVYFEDGFESGGTSYWDTVSLSDANSGVKQSPASDSSGDLAISGADEGSYFIEFQTNDYVTKTLGDLSAESDVLVKCAMAAGSMDSTNEVVGLEWYDGSAWHDLRKIGHAYNRQGWIEVTALVPSSWLSTDNRLRLMGYGGSGDYLAVDRVVVSDILHEFTTPAAPSGLSIDASVEDELSASWTVNASLSGLSNHLQEFRQRITNSGNTLSKTNVEEQTSYTTTGLRDGEKYDIRVDALYQQFRHGSTDTWWRNASSAKAPVTLLPAPTGLTSPAHGDDSVNLTWTDNHDYGDTQVQYKPTDASSWTTDTAVSLGTESHTITGLRNGEKYDLRVRAHTEHTTTVDQ